LWRVPRLAPLVALLAGLMLLACAAQARAATGLGDVVTMFSERGEYVGAGLEQEFDDANGSVTMSGGDSTVEIKVSGGTAGNSYTMDFAAPPGVTLAPGVYTNAQRAAFREAGRPGIDIFGSGRGCNDDGGLFEIRDLARDASGAIQRLWLVYEMRCEAGPTALFGEVRIGEPDDPGSGPTTTSHLIRWPRVDLDHGTQTVPVDVVATDGPLQISSVKVVGADAGSFGTRVDDCSGTTLAPGARCEIWARFTPTAPGTHIAWLRITDGNGDVRDVPLQGFAYGGHTGLHMSGDPTDWVSAGLTYDYTPANAIITIVGSRSSARFTIKADDKTMWTGGFQPPTGDILAPGTYDNASRYAFNGSGAGLDVTGDGRGCNTISGSFTVHELTFVGTDVRTFSISFEQHCEQGTPALRGEFDFRAGDTTPEPSWTIAADTPTTLDTPPPADGGGAPTPTPTPTATATPAPPETPTPAATPTPTLAATPNPTPAPTIDVLPEPHSDAELVHTVAAGMGRYSSDVRALRREAGRVRPSRIRALRRTTTKLAADVKKQIAAVREQRASTARGASDRTALLNALEHQQTTIGRLTSAVSRYAAHPRSATAHRGVVRAIGRVLAADRALAKSARRLAAL
jgi:hypothetical protein